ncbi:MAG: hypothetical protein EB127_05255 [Alphaproteobacteria bacterium]|nr:hypothetical protein [Alphaproteobacteria bacterium]
MTSCAKTTTIRSAENFEHAFVRSNRLILVPPTIEVAQKTLLGPAKRIHDYESSIEDIVTNQVQNALEDKGYKVSVLSKKSIYDAKISAQMSIFQEEAVEKMASLYNPFLMEESKALKIILDLSGSLNQIKYFNTGDIIVLPEYSFWSRSSGSQTATVLSCLLFNNSGSDSNVGERALLRISFIDAGNFKLLWSNMSIEDTSILYSTFTSSRDNHKVEAERLMRMSKNLLKPLTPGIVTPGK